MKKSFGGRGYEIRVGTHNGAVPAAKNFLRLSKDISAKSHELKQSRFGYRDYSHRSRYDRYRHGEFAYDGMSAHDAYEFEISETRKAVLDNVATPIMGEVDEDDMVIGRNVLSGNHESLIRQKVVLGYSALSSSQNPTIDSSIVWDHNVMAGPSVYLSGMGSDIDPSPDKLLTMLKAVESMRAGEDASLESIDKLLDARSKEWYRNWAKNVRPDIGSGYVQFGDYAAAAYKIDGFSRHLDTNGTLNPQIKNSIILGHNVLCTIVSGSIEHSVLAGQNVANRYFGTRIIDSHIVRSGMQGSEYIEDNEKSITEKDNEISELITSLTSVEETDEATQLPTGSNDSALLNMLQGAHFSPDSRVVLPSGQEISGDEAQVFTSMYAKSASNDKEKKDKGRSLFKWRK